MQARLKDRRKQVFNEQNRRYCCVCLVNGEKQTSCVFNERSRRHGCAQRKKPMTMVCSMNKTSSGIVVCSMKEVDDVVVFNERSRRQCCVQ